MSQTPQIWSKLNSITTNTDTLAGVSFATSTLQGTINTSLGTINSSVGTSNTKLETLHTDIGNTNSAINTNTTSVNNCYTELQTLNGTDFSTATLQGTINTSIGTSNTKLETLHTDIGNTNTAISTNTTAVNDVKVKMFGNRTYRNLDVDATGEQVIGQSFYLRTIFAINNHSTNVRYLKIYDLTSADNSDEPIYTFALYPQTNDTFNINLLMTNGCYIRATVNLADNDNTSPMANDVIVNLTASSIA